MKTGKVGYLVLLAGILLLIASIVIGSSLQTKLIELNGSAGSSKITVHLKNNTSPQANASFNRDDITQLERHGLKGMAYSAQDLSSVTYKQGHTQADIFGVSEMYRQFHDLNLVYGCFLTAQEQNQRVAVVDETLALSLFKSSRVVGLDVGLYNQQFKIIGVVAADNSLIQALTDNGRGKLYIPAAAMLNLNPHATISTLEVRTTATGATGKNTSDLGKALTAIGKSPANYQITDYNNENVLLAEKVQLTAFVLGLGLSVVLLAYCKKRLSQTRRLLKAELQHNYLVSALRIHKTAMVRQSLELLFIAAGIILIWQAVKFYLYIPPQYVPDQLHDSQFISNLLKSEVQLAVLNVGYIPLPAEMALDVLKTLQNWDFLLGIAGLFLLYLGYYQLRQAGIRSERAAWMSSLFTLVSLALSIIVLVFGSLPVSLDPKKLAVEFSFIYLLGLWMLSSRQSVHEINIGRQKQVV